jgi:hypothetical protein
MQDIPYAELGNKCPHFEVVGNCKCDDCIREEIAANFEMCACDNCREEAERLKTEWTIAMNAGAEPRKKTRGLTKREKGV